MLLLHQRRRGLGVSIVPVDRPIDTSVACCHLKALTLFWLAGILEGEGSFLARPPSSPNSPAIRLPMTDVDVVERVAAIFERAVVPTRARKAITSARMSPRSREPARLA